MTERRSIMQRPVPWALTFVVGSAILGPVLFLPPWGDAYRRHQQASLAIGVVAWSVVVAVLFRTYF